MAGIQENDGKTFTFIFKMPTAILFGTRYSCPEVFETRPQNEERFIHPLRPAKYNTLMVVRMYN